MERRATGTGVIDVPARNWSFLPNGESGFVTLMYHIVDDTVLDPISVSADTFRLHMRVLRAHDFTVLSLNDAIRIVKGEATAARRAVLVTFDDGYADNILTALPILREHGIPATLFVPTAYIGGINRWNPRVKFDTRHADWDELRDWVAAGLDIGGHAHDHTHIARLHGEELRASIDRNRALLERELGTAVRGFAYPYGEFTAEARALVRSRYDIGFSVDDGTWSPASDPYAINRIAVWPGCTEEELLDEIDRAFGLLVHETAQQTRPE
ncbi:MAG: polysaccharide deacetylase family protein [Chloroflexota bacterium]